MRSTTSSKKTTTGEDTNTHTHTKTIRFKLPSNRGIRENNSIDLKREQWIGILERGPRR